MTKTLLKFLFAFAITYWLFKSGNLDFSLISKTFSSGYSWLICLGIIVIQDIGSAYRWRMLLKIQSKEELPFIQVIKLTWIGLFFNSVLPGAVTGDLIKLVYAKDMDKSLSKTFLILSTFMDRIIGLIGLLLLLGIFSIFNFQELINLNPKMKQIMGLNLFFFLGAITFLITLFLPIKIQNFILSFTRKLPILSLKITKTLEQIWSFGKDKKVITKTLAISLVLQFLNVLGFWSITSQFYGTALPLAYVFTFIPLGFIAVAIPISPSGLGVGHAIFATLFSFVNIKGGASLFNLYFLCLVFVNIMGVFPYLLAGKKTDKEMKEMEDASA